MGAIPIHDNSLQERQGIGFPGSEGGILPPGTGSGGIDGGPNGGYGPIGGTTPPGGTTTPPVTGGIEPGYGGGPTTPDGPMGGPGPVLPPSSSPDDTPGGMGGGLPIGGGGGGPIAPVGTPIGPPIVAPGTTVLPGAGGTATEQPVTRGVTTPPTGGTATEQPTTRGVATPPAGGAITTPPTGGPTPAPNNNTPSETAKAKAIVTSTGYQTTLDTPFTTVFTSASIISSEGGTPRTIDVPITSVIAPGTVIITYDLAAGKKNSDLVPIIAGSLGGIAALIVLALVIFFMRRRRRRGEEMYGDGRAGRAGRGGMAGLDPESRMRPSAIHGLVTTPLEYPTHIHDNGNMAEIQRNFGAHGGDDYYQHERAAGQPHLVVRDAATASSLDEKSSGGGMSSTYRSGSPNTGMHPNQYQRTSSASPSIMSGNSDSRLTVSYHAAGGGGGGGMGMVYEEDSGRSPFDDDRRVVETLEDPFAGGSQGLSGPLFPPSRVLVHEDGGSVVNMAVGGNLNASGTLSHPPAYFSRTSHAGFD